MQTNKTIKSFAILWLMLFLGAVRADTKGESTIYWSGYAQSRVTTNFQEESSFAIRRAKLWLNGKAPFAGNWYYKVQSIFNIKKGGALLLQDVFAEYRGGNWQLRLGQMVPDFSLQRSQPDYLIPVVERGAIVANIIPSADTGARDIGAMAKWMTGQWHASLGIFNGNGGNQAGSEDSHFLLTHRLRISLFQNELRWQVGYSLAYRKTSGLKFSKIGGSDFTFSGRDFRWGIESYWNGKKWESQCEFIEARLGNQRAWGYYWLATINMSPKNQLVISYDKYSDLNPATNDSPWIILGFNNLFHQQKFKLMMDLRYQSEHNKFKSTIQLQLFFH